MENTTNAPKSLVELYKEAKGLQSAWKRKGKETRNFWRLWRCIKVPSQLASSLALTWHITIHSKCVAAWLNARLGSVSSLGARYAWIHRPLRRPSTSQFT